MPTEQNDLTPEQQEIKLEFTDNHGYWVEAYDILLEYDPEYLRLIGELSGHARGELHPKHREFVLISINSLSSTLYSTGVRKHIGNAFDHGATFDEIFAILEWICAIGSHSFVEGAAVLVEETENSEPSEQTITARERARETFRSERGYWDDEMWGNLVILDPDWLERYAHMTAHPPKHTKLDPKIQEFIGMANDMTLTHTFKPGLRAHMQNALDLGATPGEIVEVFEIVATTGVHTVNEIMPVLYDEANRRGELPEETPL